MVRAYTLALMQKQESLRDLIRVALALIVVGLISPIAWVLVHGSSTEQSFSSHTCQGANFFVCFVHSGS